VCVIESIIDTKTMMGDISGGWFKHKKIFFAQSPIFFYIYIKKGKRLIFEWEGMNYYGENAVYIKGCKAYKNDELEQE
jgi:hypothetical protein